jgi:hypothetical protein
MKLWPFLLVSVVIVLALCGLLVLFSGTADSDMGKHALEQAGWSEIYVTESGATLWGLQGCGDDDSVYFKADGKNPAGKDEHALVCCGILLKSCTVRDPRR